MPAHAPMEELRLRLYRPDPPEGALDDYLAAVRAAGAMPVQVPAAPAQHRRRAAGLGAVLGLVVAALAAGALLGRVPVLAGHAPPAAAAPSVVRADGRLALPPVPGIPLGSLFGGDGTGGRFDAVGRTVVVSVDCSGDGTLAVTIADEPPTVLTCEVGGPGLAMLTSTSPLHRFAVVVTRDGPVRWSLAVGTMPGT